MSAHHTPGPWRAVEWTCHAATTVIAGGVVVAECSGFGRLADESLGDARLVAAAPELLVALQLAVRQNGCDMLMTGEELRQCEAAIAKATGSAA
ncbi:hypothetical protein J2W28_001039 [Variovorax boronicumulans]|uniref:hypothetical protein n=1 Tax=Variovorax boronicumulans TaxID=436515 RepID=UPI002786F87C|nr:hypothetical protein [Variovorax boronicumulans]MDP9992011.1 hypothetical protein [Variovorax boronicumulans]MDQ0001906.1 hypothetical protein [Variovorax boronicumulans]